MRISEAFQNKPLLIVYICAGDPSPKSTPDLIRRLERAGADIIELGLPHSDPIADGPTIQAAAQRAISAGINTDLYFSVISEANVDVPKVFMGYYNMVYARGLDRFAEDCSKSGISGMIVPDLPPEEAGPLRNACERYGVDLIFLAAPNTPLKRLKWIQEQTSGFLYRCPCRRHRCAKRHSGRNQGSCSPRIRKRSQGRRLWHLHAGAGGRGHPRRCGCCHRWLSLCGPDR